MDNVTGYGVYGDHGHPNKEPFLEGHATVAAAEVVNRMAKTITTKRSSNELVRRSNSMINSTMVPETDRHAPTPGAEFKTERPDAEEICARVARIMAALRVSCPLHMDKRKRPARRHPNSAGSPIAVTEV